MTTDPVFTSREAAAIAGCTYRRLHYLLSGDVIHPQQPGRGCGSRSQWTEKDIRVLVAFAALRDLGATDSTLRPLEVSLRCLSLEGWAGAYVVTPDGNLRPLSLDEPPVRSGWLLDLGRLMPPTLQIESAAA